MTTGGECFKMNPVVKQKISKALKGNKNGLGHPCSEEKKRKISESQVGRHLTKEHKEKLSVAAHNRHTPCSEETKKLLSQNYPHQKPVLCVELNKVFPSVQVCAKTLGLHATLIVKVCKHKLHTTGGFHFQYYNDTINA